FGRAPHTGPRRPRHFRRRKDQHSGSLPETPTLHPAPNRPTRVENEYCREGAWVYLAAWGVHRAKVFGRCESQNGIAPVARLVGEVMSQEPYKSARRVFWIMDNSMSRPPVPSNGPSRAAICTLSW